MQTTTEETIYGLHPVQESLRAGRRTHVEVQIDERAPKDRFNAILKLAREVNVGVHYCSKQELFESCGSRQHQGVVLITSEFPYTELSDEIYTRDRLLLLDNIEDPRNAGAIIRSAHLFGFHTILMPIKGGSSVYPSVVKTSAGASEHVEVIRSANSNKYFQRAKQMGYRTVVLDMKGDQLLRETPAIDDRPLFLILGGEDKRVGQYILNESDVVARIPQNGEINSLNASVAAGIALYHFSSEDN